MKSTGRPTRTLHHYCGARVLVEHVGETGHRYYNRREQRITCCVNCRQEIAWDDLVDLTLVEPKDRKQALCEFGRERKAARDRQLGFEWGQDDKKNNS